MPDLNGFSSEVVENSTTDTAKNESHEQPFAAVALAIAFAIGTIFLAFIFFKILCKLSQIPKSRQLKDPMPLYTHLAIQVWFILLRILPSSNPSINVSLSRKKCWARVYFVSQSGI